MTTADDAFNKLMSKNALNIPVANPSADAEATPSSGSDTAVTVVRPLNAAGAGSTASSGVRVMNVPGDISDYNPYDDDEEIGGVYSTPTETDLDAVADTGADPTSEIEVAHRQGARILGRDADPAEFLAELANDANGTNSDDLEYRSIDAYDMDDAGYDGDDADDIDAGSGTGAHTEVHPGHGAALDRARQVRRFAYLPLGEMGAFESRARDLMANLVSQEPDKPSLAIASASRGSGQTELAIRLALSIARRVDYRILLVDFDIRKPQVAARLGVSSKYFTVTDVLRGSCPLGEALMYSEEDNLYVLPARASDRDGDEILSDRQVRRLMEQLHSTFDFVILCCGPLDHADPVILCRHAGATALAAFCRHSRTGAVAEAADRLAESGVTVAGLLLTGAV